MFTKKAIVARTGVPARLALGIHVVIIDLCSHALADGPPISNSIRISPTDICRIELLRQVFHKILPSRTRLARHAHTRVEEIRMTARARQVLLQIVTRAGEDTPGPHSQHQHERYLAHAQQHLAGHTAALIPSSAVTLFIVLIKNGPLPP